MSLIIGSLLRLESRTKESNFDNKSMSFYATVEDMEFLMGQREILLVHTCVDTGKERKWVESGMRVFNSLQSRKIKNGRHYCIYRY